MSVLETSRKTFARGVHPHGRKRLAADQPIEVLPTPVEVRIALLQHLGAPCEETLKPRTEVELGQLIGEAKAFVSAPVHASVAGQTAKTTTGTLPNGRHVMVVPIKAAEEQPLAGQALFDDIFGGDWPTEGLDRYEPKQIADAAKSAGLVGLGGAAFPTHVKLTLNPEKPISYLLVNGCECEPYLTADYRLMLEAPRPIVSGALLAGRATGADEVIICIEDNKPEAVKALQAAVDGTGVQVRVLRTKYPQGGEKQLISAVLDKEVPNGGLPLDVGVVVVNVGTAAALARATLRNKPLTHRIITVTGAGIHQPKNLLAPVGASYRELIDYCGGLTDAANRVLSGGPMMGFTLGSLDSPVTKGTSGVTVLTGEEIRRVKETSCVRCGRCVEVCPMKLVPTKLAMASRWGNKDILAGYHIGACMECGCCAYTCPARLPLVQLIRLGKILIR
jgi:electron transport complex protein RnfC